MLSHLHSRSRGYAGTNSSQEGRKYPPLLVVITGSRLTAGASYRVMPLAEASQDDVSFRRRIAHPLLRELYDFWLTRRGDRIAMLRADLDPTVIPRLLPHLIMSDVGDGGRAIRYRLVGTNIVEAHGADYTGMTIEQLTSGATLEFTHRLYGTVLNSALPVYSEGSFRWAGKEFRWTKRLHLPLSRDGSAIDMVVAGQVFEPEKTGGTELILNASQLEIAADRVAITPAIGGSSSTAPIAGRNL